MKTCLGCIGAILVALVIAVLAFICWGRYTYEHRDEIIKKKNQAIQKEIDAYPILDGNKTGRTRIENGQIIEWGESYIKDSNIKPYSVVYWNDGTENHSLYYKYHDIVIKVNVFSESGLRQFYEDGKTNNFADANVKGKSNEGILKSVDANRALNEEMSKNYID